jgi:hypothetical protein
LAARPPVPLHKRAEALFNGVVYHIFRRNVSECLPDERGGAASLLGYRLLHGRTRFELPALISEVFGIINEMLNTSRIVRWRTVYKKMKRLGDIAYRPMDRGSLQKNEKVWRHRISSGDRGLRGQSRAAPVKKIIVAAQRRRYCFYPTSGAMREYQ